MAKKTMVTVKNQMKGKERESKILHHQRGDVRFGREGSSEKGRISAR